MRRPGLGLPLALGLALAWALAPAPALADKAYTTEQQIKHDCRKEGTVTVKVAGATAVFTGTCTKIEIIGADNKVTIAAVKKLKVSATRNTVDVVAADEITATGWRNIVTYKKSVSGRKTVAKAPGIESKVNQIN
jgi:hypothetical protein